MLRGHAGAVKVQRQAGSPRCFLISLPVSWCCLSSPTRAKTTIFPSQMRSARLGSLLGTRTRLASLVRKELDYPNCLGRQPFFRASDFTGRGQLSDVNRVKRQNITTRAQMVIYIKKKISWKSLQQLLTRKQQIKTVRRLPLQRSGQ